MLVPRRVLPALLAAVACVSLLAAGSAAAPRTAAAASSAAGSWTAPCVPGTSAPTCTWWSATVDHVSDGDTLVVDVAGDGTSTLARVRVTGIQAMEQSVYHSDPRRRRGECHALAATARLEQLVAASGGKVRLSARDAASHSRHRLRRSVAVRLDGRWQDVGSVLVREGHALWLSNPVEYAWNARYARSAARAAEQRLRVWDPDSCGSGPAQGARIRVWVHWDALGPDTDNLNDEWVRVQNQGAQPLPLGGWWLRDSDLRRYTFPTGTVVPAGDTVTLHVGSGRNTATRFYWGLSGPVFDSATGAPASAGDGAYLFDPHGDLRAWMTYPCVERCTDPLQGALEVQAHERTPEHVTVRNRSAGPVRLDGYRVESPPYTYPLDGVVLGPGQSLRLYTGSGSDRGLVRWWGRSGRILADAGDVVQVSTYTGVVLDCAAWGNRTC